MLGFIGVLLGRMYIYIYIHIQGILYAGVQFLGSFFCAGG